MTEMVGVATRFRRWWARNMVKGNPNVVQYGVGDILYCRSCDETVDSIDHECGNDGDGA